MASALQTVAMFQNILQYKPTFAESLQIHSSAAFRQNQLLMQQEQIKAKKGIKLRDELESVQSNIGKLENKLELRESKREAIDEAKRRTRLR